LTPPDAPSQLRPFLWVVLFDEGEDDATAYEPIVLGPTSIPPLHGFDINVVPVLDAVWYFMHLPRDPTDFLDRSHTAMMESKKLDVPHNILVLPLRFTRAQLLTQLRGLTLVACPDEHVNDLHELLPEPKPLLGVVPFSTLSAELLLAHWNVLADGTRVQREVSAHLAVPLSPLDIGAPTRLPLLHFERHLRGADTPANLRLESAVSELVYEALFLHNHVNAVARLEASGCEPEAFDERYEAERRQPTRLCHVVLGAPGAARAEPAMTRKHRLPIDAITSADATVERRVVDLMIAHRATARDGIGLHLADTPRRAFGLLRDLESAIGWSSKPRKARQALERIGKILGGALTDEQCSALKRSASVTAFTDFPWGLAILPGDTSPVCTATPFTYRPLTPLTRAFQLEMRAQPVKYLGESLSILIAECLADDDRLLPLSRATWQGVTQQLNEIGAGRASCVYRPAKSLAQLHQLLDEAHYDVLVLSAHGVADQSRSVAALQIGREHVLDLAHHLPPVVMFSACSVWPRGTGAVSVSDLALRHGAMAILGTLLPVDARHTGFVINRALLYMILSVLGSEPETTVADAVARALASNAVIDILHGSAAMRAWGFSEGPYGVVPQVEFMSSRSHGRLRAGHIYADSESVLVDIARDHGPDRERMVKQFLSASSYVPETLFYTLIGCPERVVLRPRVSGEDRIHRGATGQQHSP
jgi:hypothetical protein